MKKSAYDIIRNLIEKIIIPKYPFLKIGDIDSYILTNFREYDVRLITPKKLEPEVQMEIDSEIKSLFKMASLDEVEKYQKNKIVTWFKTPRAEEWSFKGIGNYEHI